jgi:hypothetical protein
LAGVIEIPDAEILSLGVEGYAGGLDGLGYFLLHGIEIVGLGQRALGRRVLKKGFPTHGLESISLCSVHGLSSLNLTD